MKNKGCAKIFFGGGEGGQIRCIMGDVQVENRRYRFRRLILDSTVSCDVTERHLHPFPGFARTTGQDRTLRDYAAENAQQKLYCKLQCG